MGGLAHLTWWEGEDCHNIDGWESMEAFNAFGAERLGPAMAQVGVTTHFFFNDTAATEIYTPRMIKLI